MRISEILAEKSMFELDKATINWEKSDNAWEGHFEIPARNGSMRFVIHLNKAPNRWMVFLSSDRPDLSNNNIELAKRAFTTCFEGLLEFMKEMMPELVQFSGATPSRVKLYKLASIHYLDQMTQMGYRFVDGNGYFNIERV